MGSARYSLLLRSARVAKRTETAYRFVLQDKAVGGALYKYLRHQHKKYRKRYGSIFVRRSIAYIFVCFTPFSCRIKEWLIYPETAYRFVLQDKAVGGALYKYLRHQHKKYRKRYGKNNSKRPMICSGLQYSFSFSLM
jgi:IS30 family transposase